jgi:methylmalonyl-CoA mutase
MTASFEAWREVVSRELDGTTFEDALVTRLREGLAIHPLYVESPATRPALPRPASLAVITAIDDPAAAAALAAEDFAGGADGVELDLTAAPSGVLPAIASGSRVLVLDPGLDLASLPELDATLRRGDTAQVNLHLAGDPLAALAERGALPTHPAELNQGRLRWARQLGARLLIDLLPHHEAGADATLELAYATAAIAEHLRWCGAEGLREREVAMRLGVRLGLGRDVFLELAKLRALRVLFAKVFAAAGVPAAEQPAAYLLARTARRCLTRRDPWVNLLRVAGHAFAAITGGADGFTPLGFDAAYGRSDRLARRIARNTPLILREEGRLGGADPATGSYYLESLTLELARRAWDHFRSIEAEGGLTAALISGRIAREVAASWARLEGALAAGSDHLVGATDFVRSDEEPLTRAPWPKAPEPEAAWTVRAPRLAPQREAEAAERNFGGTP